MSDSDITDSPTRTTAAGKKAPGTRPKKAQQAEDAARLLLADHTRTGDEIADEVDCKPRIVAGTARQASEQ